jgi:pimeloyl-ACP methyl ester carboxylesterase
MRPSFLLPCALLLAGGCTHDSDETDLPDTGADSGDTGDNTGNDVTWSTCPLFVDEPAGEQAECATVDLPLRWDEPDGPTLGVFVQRLLGAAEERRGQLFLLEGGPGGSGADFDTFMRDFHETDPSLDLYAVDHRGTGRSGRLGCPQEDDASAYGFYISPDEWPDCIASLEKQWGSDLAEFSTTAAAHDVGALVDLLAEPGKQTFVYGVSYGTYWAHRYLQLFPDQADAVILDSIAPSGEDFTSYDLDFDAVGEDLMGECGSDPLCSSKLGLDPWAALDGLFARIDEGHCPDLVERLGLGRTYLRYMLGELLMYVDTRPFVPAVTYRFERCDDADVDALTHLALLLFASRDPTYYDRFLSTALFYNVAISELWPEKAPPVETFQAEVEGLRTAIDLSPRVAALQDAWPRYPDDAYVGQWADTSTPMLMLNGDLDPETPIWLGGRAEKHFTGENQYFFRVPYAAHCTLVQSPVATAGAEDCGMQIFRAFLADPLTRPDDACLSDTLPVDFDGDEAYSEYLLATPDMWENDVVGVASLTPPPGLAPRLGRIVPPGPWVR